MPVPTDSIAWAVKAFRDDRAGRYATYRRYLDGDHPLGHIFTDTPARRLHNIRYNRCAAVVDAHADRLRVSGFGSDDADRIERSRRRGEPVSDDVTTLAQQAEDLWNRNHMDIHEGQLAVESFAIGDAYLLVTVHPVTGAAQFWPQNADQMRVHYDEEQPGVIDLAAKFWIEDDTELGRLNIYFADRIEKYRTTTKARSGMPRSPQAFEEYTPDGDTTWPVRLPVTDTVPVFHFANNGRVNSYGVSELRDIIPLQDMLNASLVRQFAAEHYLTWRQRAILNYDLSNEEDRAAMSALVTGMNQIIGIPPNAEGEAEPKLAEFSAADMAQFDLVAEKHDIRIARQSKVPVHHLTQTSIANSGRAQRIAEGPLVAKVRDRQLERGPVYGNAVTYGLRCEGAAIHPGALRVNWESASSMSEDDMWELAGMKRDAGWPIKAIAREMGRDPDEIDQILREIAEEREAGLEAVGTFAGAPEPDDDAEV